jgi:hypothetical protein
MRGLGISALVVLAGLLLWATALYSVGRTGEDLCFDDMNVDRGGYTSSGSLFPPQVECRYRLADGSTEVNSHPIRAWTTFGIVVLFPPAYLIGALILWRTAISRGIRSK